MKNTKNKKKIFMYRHYLSALFASFATLVIGTVSLLENESIDYYTVMAALRIVIPSALVLGGIGWVMGMVLDKPKKSNQIKYDNSLMNEWMKGADLTDEEMLSLSANEEPSTSDLPEQETKKEDK